MKRLIILLTFTLTLLLVNSIISFGQNGTTYNVEQVRDLHFGNIAPKLSGTIKIDATAQGNPNPSAGTFIYGNMTSSAMYVITRIGNNNTTITKITATTSTTIKRDNGTNTMNVNSLTVYPVVNSSNKVNINATTPTFTFYVGGILNLGTTPTSGGYTGQVKIAITP